MNYKKNKTVLMPKLTGYILGNDNNVFVAGDRWEVAPGRVWICRDLRTAKNILHGSHAFMLNRGTVWTTIYRVHADDIMCMPSVNPEDKNLIFTYESPKIVVDGPVHYEEPQNFNKCVLLNGARAMKIGLFFSNYAARGK